MTYDVSLLIIAYVTVIKRQGVSSKTVNAEKRKYNNKITKKNGSLNLETSNKQFDALWSKNNLPLHI